MNLPATQNSMERQQILHQLLFDNNSMATLKDKPVSEINILEISTESMSSNFLSSMSSFSQDKQNYFKLKKLSEIIQKYSKRVYQNINNVQNQKLMHMKTNLKGTQSNQTIQQNQKEFISQKNKPKQELVFESFDQTDKLVNLEQVPKNSKRYCNLKQQTQNKQKQKEISIWSIFIFIFVIFYCSFLIF